MYGCNRPFWPLPYAKAYSLELDWILAELRKLQEAGLGAPIETIIQSIDELKATLDTIVATPGTVYNSQKLGGHAPEYFLTPLENIQQSIAEIRAELEAIVASPGTVYDAQKLGGKSPEYYLSQQNLLDNSDWRIKKNIINQRGQESYTGAVYGIDRWFSFLGANTVTINDGYITLTNANFVQRVPAEALRDGQYYTFAAKKTDGTILLNTHQYPMKTVSGAAGMTMSLLGKGDDFVAITTQGINSYEWAALYEGKYTAETLPPYVPKPYVVELAECQRYYTRLKSGNAFYGFGSSSGSSAYLYYDLPQQMRLANPSATSSGSFHLQTSSGSVAATTISNATTFGKQLEITVSSTITANRPFIGYADAVVEVSADL